MTDFFATFRISHHTQNIHVSGCFFLEGVEIRELFSSLDLDFTFFLMCFSIECAHGFGGVLCDTELSSYLFFLFLQVTNLLLTPLSHSLFTTEPYLRLSIIFLFLILWVNCLSALLDVLYLTVHEMRVWLFHFFV